MSLGAAIYDEPAPAIRKPKPEQKLWRSTLLTVLLWIAVLCLAVVWHTHAHPVGWTLT